MNPPITVPIVGFLLSVALPFSHAEAQEVLDRVVASVNDSVITQRQIDSTIPQLVRLFSMPDGPTKGVVPPPDVLRRQALDKLIDEELLLQKWKGAFRKNTAQRMAERAVDEFIRDLRKKMGEQRFQAELAKENQTLKEFRALQISERRRQILIRQSTQAWIDGFLLTPVSDTQIEQYLKDHPEIKEKGGSLETRLILVRVPRNADKNKRIALRRRAERVLNKARVGEPFEELVQTYSEHERSKEQGGRFILDSPVSPFPEFAPVFEVKVGQVYPKLIRIPAGWCIVQVTSKRNLHNLTRRAMANEEFRKALKKVREEATILYDHDLFGSSLESSS